MNNRIIKIDINELPDLLAQRKAFISIMSGTNEKGKNCYYYIAFHKDNVQDYKDIITGEKMETDDYLVLASGEGVPDENTMKMIEEKYGFNHQKLLKIPKDLFAKKEVKVPADSESDKK